MRFEGIKLIRLGYLIFTLVNHAIKPCIETDLTRNICMHAGGDKMVTSSTCNENSHKKGCYRVEKRLDSRVVDLVEIYIFYIKFIFIRDYIN